MSSPSIELYNQALDAIQAGKLDDALSCVEKSLTEDPKDSQTWQLYSVILNALGRSDDAAKAMAKVQELGLDPIDELMMKAADAAAAGEIGKAITYYEDAIEIDESRFELHVSYALVLLEGKYEKDALDASAKAIELGSNEASAWYARGRVLRRVGHHEDALDALTRACDIDAGLLAAQHERGILLADNKEFAEALKCFEAVLAVHPNDPNAMQAREAMMQALRS